LIKSLIAENELQNYGILNAIKRIISFATDNNQVSKIKEADPVESASFNKQH